MKQIVMLVALCSLGLAACVVPSPRGAKVVVPVPVVVEQAPAKHCPPGQAKKGNC